MAKLYKRQEKAIIKWIKDNPDKATPHMLAEDLPIYDEVFAMYPHENFNSNVERVLWDNIKPADDGWW